jgi:hypothetical protein
VADTKWVGPDSDNLDRMEVIVKDLRALRDSPGKKYLDKYWRHRYDILMAGLANSPLQALDHALQQEYVKGQAIQCLSFGEEFQAIIADFEAQIEELRAARAFEESTDEENDDEH